MASVRRNLLRVILLAGAALLFIWLVRIADPRYILRTVLQKIQNLGPLAPLYFILTYILACLTFFPGVILTLGGGVLFGLVKGTFYVSIGATIGAALAFLLSRHLARDWVYAKFSRNDKFRAIDDAVAADGWKVVGLIRLSPVLPFIPMNFVFGLTKIPFTHFVIVTWFSILPMTAMFVYLGSLIGDIAALGSQPMATGKAKWIVSGIGIAATIIVTFFITRIARRALAGRIPDSPANEAPEDCAASG
jgi:uncharacterized membrane protein YdjX (TVP38/TMEM64 family)